MDEDFISSAGSKVASGRKNIAIKDCLIEVLPSREGLGLFQGLKEPAIGAQLCFSVCSQARGGCC